MANDRSKTYTKSDILIQLDGLGLPRDGIVLMHSSLRLVGKLEEGAKTLLDAMIEYFTADGGLFCVPTRTWAFLNRPVTLDMTDPVTCLGAFSNFAAADPRGIRSENPTHSMAVFGDRARAEAFISDEPHVSSGTAPNSCYGKICEAGGHILLVGVAHNKNTCLHAAEEILGMQNRLSAEKHRVTVRRADGETVVREVFVHHTGFTADISARFPKYETAFRYHGAIRDGFIGSAPTQACDARIMKDVMEMILKNCGDTDPLGTEFALSPLWFA